MKLINLHNRVTTADLVDQLNVSEDTVRRDLQELEQNNKLNKVHGGALSNSYHHAFNQPNIYAKEIKHVIGAKAINLFKDGMMIIIGGGTTVLEMVNQIPKKLKATFITISPIVAIELSKFEFLEVILLGGPLSKNSQVTYGANVINQLRSIRADLCVIGTSAIHPERGLTDSDWEINELKKSMMASASKSVILCISEKLDTQLRLKVCGLEEVDYLITELSAEDQNLNPYRNNALMLM